VPPADTYPRVELDRREEWRAWLAEHHADQPGVWLVSAKKATGRPQIGYEPSVEEALCFGWIDSLGRRLDEERSMLLFTPRKAGSNWSRPNKERIERLLAAGAMAPAGLATVERAKADGTWTALDEVEALVVPDDLAAALARHPGASEHWEAFPRSVKRGVLEWIMLAKRPPTRAKRIEETATLAASGERANQWRGPAAR
jgi:uncharacterized protein YdeI (YjbR/CyaY-like superfamily)